MTNNKLEQLCFNELTLLPLCSNDTEVYERIMNYTQTLKSAGEVLGTKKIRYNDSFSNIKLSKTISLQEFCSKYKREVGIILILSMQTRPLIDPSDEDKYSKYKDITASLKFNEQLKASQGLAAAYIYDVPLIGFDSERFYNNTENKNLPFHAIHVVSTSSKKEENLNWPCLTTPEHIKSISFNHWLEEHSDEELEETDLTPDKKKIHLSDDHGKDILMHHAKKLCNNKYVVEILGSLPYRPKYKSYILNVDSKGIVDIVLPQTNQGLSLRVKTTGRNKKETRKIASILEREYGK